MIRTIAALLAIVGMSARIGVAYQPIDACCVPTPICCEPALPVDCCLPEPECCGAETTPAASDSSAPASPPKPTPTPAAPRKPTPAEPTAPSSAAPPTQSQSLSPPPLATPAPAATEVNRYNSPPVDPAPATDAPASEPPAALPTDPVPAFTPAMDTTPAETPSVEDAFTESTPAEEPAPEPAAPIEEPVAEPVEAPASSTPAPATAESDPVDAVDLFGDSTSEAEEPASETPATDQSTESPEPPPATENKKDSDENLDYSDLFGPSASASPLHEPGGWESTESRPWSYQDGEQLAYARIAGIDGGTVTLLSETGRVMKVAVAEFSDDDLAFLRRQVEARQIELAGRQPVDSRLADQSR